MKIKKLFYSPTISWLLVVLWMLVIFIFSSISDFSAVAPVGPTAHEIIAKAVHIISYSILTILLVVAILSSSRWHEKFWHGPAGYRWLYFFIAFIIASLYGASDEWHQMFTPKRNSSVWDWALDSAASLFALMLIYFYAKYKKRSVV